MGGCRASHSRYFRCVPQPRGRTDPRPRRLLYKFYNPWRNISLLRVVTSQLFINCGRINTSFYVITWSRKKPSSSGMEEKGRGCRSWKEFLVFVCCAAEKDISEIVHFFLKCRLQTEFLQRPTEYYRHLFRGRGSQKKMNFRYVIPQFLLRTGALGKKFWIKPLNISSFNDQTGKLSFPLQH